MMIHMLDNLYDLLQWALRQYDFAITYTGILAQYALITIRHFYVIRTIIDDVRNMCLNVIKASGIFFKEMSHFK